MKVWKVEYFTCGDLARSVVLAKTMKEAIDFVVDGVNVEDVKSCVEVREAGRVLTWHQP